MSMSTSTNRLFVVFRWRPSPTFLCRFLSRRRKKQFAQNVDNDVDVDADADDNNENDDVDVECRFFDGGYDTIINTKGIILWKQTSPRLLFVASVLSIKSWKRLKIPIYSLQWDHLALWRHSWLNLRLCFIKIVINIYWSSNYGKKLVFFYGHIPVSLKVRFIEKLFLIHQNRFNKILAQAFLDSGGEH